MFELPLFQVENFVFVLVRVSSIFVAAPVLSSRALPVQLKVGLVLFLTFAMLPSARVVPSDFPGSLPLLVMGLGSEILLGVAIGLMARLMLATVQIMGQMVGFQMGFGIAMVIDPATMEQQGVIASFLSMFATLIFLVTNGHHLFFRALAESFRVLAPFGFSASQGFVDTLARTFQNVFVVAFRMGAPIFAILLFVYTGLGIIARTVPQINIFVVGFPLTISIGLVALGLVLPYLVVIVRGIFGQLGHDIVLLLRTM
ncbi:MAG: flagellar biosynthetic protein FliR [Deltaproteobacteria bacterium]|nr:flagellar biosynthetic protein FliR [Deltaproteobacteria bacterium]